jgi:hypothetical protein
MSGHAALHTSCEMDERHGINAWGAGCAKVMG